MKPCAFFLSLNIYVSFPLFTFFLIYNFLLCFDLKFRINLDFVIRDEALVVVEKKNQMIIVISQDYSVSFIKSFQSLLYSFFFFIKITFQNKSIRIMGLNKKKILKTKDTPKEPFHFLFKYVVS